MKTIIITAAIIGSILAACHINNNKPTGEQDNRKDTGRVTQQTEATTISSSTFGNSKNTVSVKEIVTAYLQLKNAFADDNTTNAATAGTLVEATFKNFDKTTLTTEQKKTFEDIADDATEHGEHIGKNGGNIAHQREHFEMLSKDIYDLVKVFGDNRTLYKDFCPMYNHGKGAYWISETKEISNPYLGKAMPTCGVLKEKIK